MTYKIAVSKAGYNVLTETDSNNLIFSSSYNTLKYATSGSSTVTVPSNENPFTQENVIVTHNLGYVPFFVAFMKESGLTRYYNLPYGIADWWGYIYFFLYSTTTQLILRTEMSNNLSQFNFTVWYKIFKNNTGL